MDAEDITRSLGRLEGRVDMVLEELCKQDGRISAVERKAWYASGASAVVAALAVKLGLPLIPGGGTH